MSDLLHWTSALLALLGLTFWFWSGGLRMPQLKRQIQRVAIVAALTSAVLQAVGPPDLTMGSSDAELWASAAPASLSPIA